MYRQKEEPAPWTLWHEEEEPAINGKGRRWRLRCSVCLQDLECAVVFPEHALRLCFKCLGRIHGAAINGQPATAPSDPSVAGPEREACSVPDKGHTQEEV